MPIAPPPAPSLLADDTASGRNPRAQLDGDAAPRRVRIAWPHAVLAVIGGAISMYAWHLHGVIAAGGSSGCGFTETISCDRVIGSQYGKIFGLPLGAYGLLFFAIILVLSISAKSDAAALRSAALQRLAVAAVGVCSSAALTYISLAKIHAACPVCMSTHATTFAILCASLWEVSKMNRKGAKAPRKER